jgi:hypothetical protein
MDAENKGEKNRSKKTEWNESPSFQRIVLVNGRITSVDFQITELPVSLPPFPVSLSLWPRTPAAVSIVSP